MLSLIDLWLAAAANRPKGILMGMTEEDIALDAQWSGDPGEFCRSLCDIGFLDRSADGTYSIHDWKEHQAFCFYSEERSKQAKEAIAIRWTKRRGQNKDSICPVYEPNNGRNTPIPSPIPKKGKLFVQGSIEFELAAFLLDQIRKNKPDFKTPNLQSWGKDFDLMIQRDKREPDRIKKVISWAQADSFWSCNILSAGKLREKYDHLEMKMGKSSPAKNPPPGNGTEGKENPAEERRREMEAIEAVPCPQGVRPDFLKESGS